MNFLTQITHSSRASALLLDAAWKSALLLGAAALICFAWRRASAATRHWVWFVALVCLLLLPGFTFLVPAWSKPLLAVSTNAKPGNEVTLTVELGPGDGSAPEATLATASRLAPRPAPVSGSRLSAQLHGRWLLLVPVIWLLGAAGVLIFVVAGQVRVWGMARHGRSVIDSDWMTLLQQRCAAAGIGRTVRLLQGEAQVMPMTWGTLRPVILLPEAAAHWPEQKRRVVLSHELAHVKRCDCLTQTISGIVCALYWFNPLVWLAVRRMNVERERACDDLVLQGGAQATDYATQLVEIARTFRRVAGVAAIAMARSSQLETRIIAIVDATRARGLSRRRALLILGGLGGLAVALAACETRAAQTSPEQVDLLRRQQIAQLMTFSAAKEKQSRAYAAQDGDAYSSDFERFFRAAKQGDGSTVTNMFADFKRRHGQYEHSTGDLPHDSSWSPVLEVAIAYYEIIAGEPHYEQLAIDGMLRSIPAGSIYFGGTDPGRGLPTAFTKSQIDGDPFFVLTQNALADGTYLDYLRRTYAKRIYTPTEQDSKQCFAEYIQDAESRLKENKLKPGEDVRSVNGKTEVTGQMAVMAVNGLLARVIFDKNPEREFYIEESFPLDWMYPYLEPHGLIMKIDRKPIAELSGETLKKDRDYWRGLVAGMLGDWLNEETSVQDVVDFVKKVYLQHDFQGFMGDPRFIASEHAQKLFSKFRSSIAGLYAWRMSTGVTVNNAPERERMTKQADFAFRQAFAICPSSPEATFRYVNFLAGTHRLDDALLISEAAAEADPANKQLDVLIRQLKTMLVKPAPSP